MTPDHELIPVSAVAERLGLDKKTIYAMIAEGKINHERFGTSIRVYWPLRGPGIKGAGEARDGGS